MLVSFTISDYIVFTLCSFSLLTIQVVTTSICRKLSLKRFNKLADVCQMMSSKEGKRLLDVRVFSWKLIDLNLLGLFALFISSQNYHFLRFIRNYKTRSPKRLDERYKGLKAFLDWFSKIKICIKFQR